jgi:predicted peroxiredoxin
MPGLTVILASADAERARAGLEVAAANAALGQPTHMFVQGVAARLLGELDRAAAPGAPTLGMLLEEAMALGVTVTVCQSGLALAGLRADCLPPGIETGGLIGLLSGAGESQLLMA